MNLIALLIATCVLAPAFVWGDCGTDEKNLNNEAKSHSQGKSPDGKCYSHVADYIDAVGFGGINKGHFNDAIPSAYWSYAYQFAEYLNQGNNAAKHDHDLLSMDGSEDRKYWRPSYMFHWLRETG